MATESTYLFELLIDISEIIERIFDAITHDGGHKLQA